MKRHRCIVCGRSTRRSIRMAIVGEDHRLVICSNTSCNDKMTVAIRNILTPVERLLVAIYGGYNNLLQSQFSCGCSCTDRFVEWYVKEAWQW